MFDIVKLLCENGHKWEVDRKTYVEEACEVCPECGKVASKVIVNDQYKVEQEDDGEID